jgi:hypothetical protein
LVLVLVLVFVSLETEIVSFCVCSIDSFLDVLSLYIITYSSHELFLQN